MLMLFFADVSKNLIDDCSASFCPLSVLTLRALTSDPLVSALFPKST